jgi:Tol biopolymer transport system component/DNA-binding winged helix-turn-helix (wHTH) protein
LVETLHSLRLVKFADFDVDLQAGELRRAGVRLKLTGQPFQVLAILLERPGEVVTRGELQKRLWPDTFVDVDHNLNTAINKIREVLGDSAENPRFVETLARRGYRFVAPILEPKPIVKETQSAIVEATPEPSPSLRKRKSRLMTLSLGSLIGAVVLAFLFRSTIPAPRVTASKQVTNDGLNKWQFATDGTRIYFSSYSGFWSRLHQVSLAGGTTVPIQTSLQNPVVLDISPDRSELLILSCEYPDSVDCLLFVLPLLGQSARRVGDVRANSAAWSPDGKEIAYGETNSLYRVRVDGSESTKIASFAEGDDVRWPRWSPDGSHLRFTVSNRNGDSLWEVSANRTNLHRMLSGWNNPPTECCGTWTPNGKYFVFRSRRSGVSNIWAVNEAKSFFRKVGREPVQLTSSPAPTFWPLVSLDGKKIFVVASQVRGELVSYNATSRQFSPYLSGISAISVTFSEDGNWVAYSTYPEGTLWRSKVDGS